LIEERGSYEIVSWVCKDVNSMSVLFERLLKNEDERKLLWELFEV
jgi:hypothetical protein